MYDREHLSTTDDSINLKIGRIKVDAFFNSFLVIVDINKPLIMGLIEPIDLILHVFAQSIDLFLGQPFRVKIASSSVFDEILVLIRIFPNSSP